MTNQATVADVSDIPARGRLLGLDPGTKRCGVAVCDEMHITTTPLTPLARTNWKKLLGTIKELVARFDAKGLVVGLPLESDGSDGPMTVEARNLAAKFAASLDIPVVLQDERVTSYEARRRLWAAGEPDATRPVDSEAAAIILADLLDRLGSPRGR